MLALGLVSDSSPPVFQPQIGFIHVFLVSVPLSSATDWQRTVGLRQPQDQKMSGKAVGILCLRIRMHNLLQVACPTGGFLVLDEIKLESLPALMSQIQLWFGSG